MKYDYDLFVIGGGSGGVRAGRRAASLGKKVGIAEESRYGGTCVVRGCIPKKLYVYASEFPESFEDAKSYGWTVGETTFDWNVLVANKEAEITRLEGLYQKGLLAAGAEVFQTRAELRGAHEIWLKEENRVVTAERIIIAVGGAPRIQTDLEGYELCIVSDDIFDLPELPKKVVISGAGYIAVEFAGILNGLGVDTTIVYRRDEILAGFDEDVRKHLHREYEARGIKIITNTTFEKVEDAGDGNRRVHLSNGDVLEVDCVFQAVGRTPLTKGLGLENANVKTDGAGNIVVNEYSRTNVESIWALGDVTDRVQLTPVAIHEAMCFIATEYLDDPQRPDHELIATAVFSHPEIGTVGLTQEQAGEAFEDVEVYRAEFRPMRNTLTERTSKMLMKLIVDAASQKVVGVHVVGSAAGEMSQLLAIPLKMGASKPDFDRTMAVHPTAAEELVTMYEPSYLLKNGVRVG